VTDEREAEPFEQTTRPSAYVPRPETEQLLDHLQTWARGGSTASIRLTGAAGMGKSLLLKVLAERTAGQPAAVHIPYPNLMPDDLAAWVIEAIGEQRGLDSQEQLVAVANQRSASGGLLLLIDDAERLPAQTHDALDLWFRRSEGNLRSVRAAVGDSAAADDVDREGEGPALTHELDVEQSTALLTAAMDRAGLHGPLRAHFNHAVMLRLHDRARGVPARLLTEAARLYREWSAGVVPPMPTLPGREPSRAPTQRELAQLELALAATSAPATIHHPQPLAIPELDVEQSPQGAWESPGERSEHAIPHLRAEQSPQGAWESPSERSEHAEPRSANEPESLLGLPPQPPPPPSSAVTTPSRVPLRWIAAAGAGVLLGAVASTLLPTTRDGDATIGDTPAAVSEPPPVAAAPALALLPSPVSTPVAPPESTPVPSSVSTPVAPPESTPVPPPASTSVVPPVAPPTPIVDAGVGSIEFLDVIPAAPDPAPEEAGPKEPEPVRAAARIPAEIEALTDAGNVVVEGVIESGEWLAASFRRRNIPGELAGLIAREIGDAYDFRHSQPGDRYRVTLTRDGELVAFDYGTAENDQLELRLADGRYRLQRGLSR